MPWLLNSQNRFAESVSDAFREEVEQLTKCWRHLACLNWRDSLKWGLIWIRKLEGSVGMAWLPVTTP